jgi:hypothetical protein
MNLYVMVTTKLTPLKVAKTTAENRRQFDSMTDLLPFAKKALKPIEMLWFFFDFSVRYGVFMMGT